MTVTCRDCGERTEPQYTWGRLSGTWNPRVGAFDNCTYGEIMIERCERCQDIRDAAEARSERLSASSYGLGL